MSGFAISGDGDFSKAIEKMDTLTREWEMRAARGECSWICADCCCTFPKGMPDACEHGHQGCTDIIQRDKRAAAAEIGAQAAAQQNGESNE